MLPEFSLAMKALTDLDAYLKQYEETMNKEERERGRGKGIATRSSESPMFSFRVSILLSFIIG